MTYSVKLAEEYKKAKDRILLKKASGPDNIPLEVIKKCNLIIPVPKKVTLVNPETIKTLTKPYYS